MDYPIDANGIITNFKAFCGRCGPAAREILKHTAEMENKCYECGFSQEPAPYGIYDKQNIADVFGLNKGNKLDNPINEYISNLILILKSAYEQGELDANKEKAPSTTAMAREHA